MLKTLDTLSAHGLNLHAVFEIVALPEDMYASLAKACNDLEAYRQVILIGHGGRDLWKAVSPLIASGEVAEPIDTFTVNTIKAFFAEYAPGMLYQVVYPGTALVPLQRLGALAGWHNDSPFKVGVNQIWGSWFAYRALLLADSELMPSKPLTLASPCVPCDAKPCIQACPAKAMADGEFELDRCVSFRKMPGSPCRQRCLARLACPVGAEHRYSDGQLSYHYSHSLRVLINWDNSKEIVRND